MRIADIASSAPSPIEGDEHRVDIHKPKPFHGWREFFKEYGIIVLGVLTALAGEQVVEAIHYRSEMHEAREALKIEIQSNLWSVSNRLSMGPCVARRLTDLDRWAASQRNKDGYRLNRPVAIPTVQVTGTSVWRIATAGVVARMPFEDRVHYALIYDTIATADGISARMADTWRDLGMLSDGQRLSDNQIYQVKSDIAQL